MAKTKCLGCAEMQSCVVEVVPGQCSIFNLICSLFLSYAAALDLRGQLQLSFSPICEFTCHLASLSTPSFHCAEQCIDLYSSSSSYPIFPSYSALTVIAGWLKIFWQNVPFRIQFSIFSLFLENHFPICLSFFLFSISSVLYQRRDGRVRLVEWIAHLVTVAWNLHSTARATIAMWRMTILTTRTHFKRSLFYGEPD